MLMLFGIFVAVTTHGFLRFLELLQILSAERRRKFVKLDVIIGNGFNFRSKLRLLYDKLFTVVFGCVLFIDSSVLLCSGNFIVDEFIEHPVGIVCPYKHKYRNTPNHNEDDTERHQKRNSEE